jgi:hypothetical protein
MGNKRSPPPPDPSLNAQLTFTDIAVVGLLTTYGDLDTLRRVTVETTQDGLTVGHAEFRPLAPPDALTVAELAEQGELPGRKLAREWRFARDAVLDWLARR